MPRVFSQNRNRRVHLIRLRAFVTAAVLFVAIPASAQTFVFHLRGDQVVPPVPTVASGGCFGVLDQPGATFALTCVHDVVTPTTMHIRRGAAGLNGPSAFDLGDPTVSPVTATWSSMTAVDIADLLAGNLYIDIRTAARPGGEIRGQNLSRTVDLVAFTAEGAQVVPPDASAATANCTADLDGPATSLAVQCTHNVAGPTSAHVHEAPFGTTGSIAFTFPSPASPLNGNMPMTPALVANFAATFLYLDIHAATEEIRGQIGTPPAGPTTGSIIIEKETFPAGGTAFGFTETINPGAFNLDDGDTATFSGVAPGTYTVTENDPSASGHSLADIVCDNPSSSGDVNTRAATITVTGGETVRCTFRNLETSPTDQLFVFHLSVDQVVPPVATAERGGCMGRFDAGASELSIVCTHDVGLPMTIDIHRGAPGVNGPIVFDLGAPASPVIATWSGMTPADVADLLAGNFHVDIHTAARPAGAIRGQILTRTVDTVTFPADASQVVPPGSSAATANCTADLDNTATALGISCTHNLAGPVAAHVHQAPRGSNGPIAFTFPSPVSPMNANMPVTPRLVADFAATFLYLDIHAAVESIRGQIGGTPVADLAVTKSGPATIVAGNNVTYTVTLTNNGPSAAQNVTLADPLPAGVTFVSNTQTTGPTFTCAAPAGSVNCTIATLAAGTTSTFSFVYQVPASTAGGTTITNTASVSSSTNDLVPMNNSASASTTVSAASVDLAVTKTA